MFDCFYKHDSARSHEGTGLGLTAAKRSAEVMQGNLTAEIHHEIIDARTSCVLTLLLVLRKYTG